MNEQTVIYVLLGVIVSGFGSYFAFVRKVATKEELAAVKADVKMILAHLLKGG